MAIYVDMYIKYNFIKFAWYFQVASAVNNAHLEAWSKAYKEIKTGPNKMGQGI